MVIHSEPPAASSPLRTREKLEILYEDGDIVAIDKPAGLAVAPGRGETETVLDRLARQLNIPHEGKADPRLRLVHRLDKETSGVFLLAKNIAAQRALCAQFLKGQVHKEYLAIVSGRPPANDGTIDAPIGPHPSHKRQMAVTKTGRRAVTRWRLEKRLGPFALVRCFPETGRTHQIRVHLKSIGLPLAVDSIYSARSGPAGILLSRVKPDYRKSGHEERPLIARLTLHAEKLTIKHPDGRTIELHCPPPKDFRATVMQLGKLTGAT